MNRTTPHARGFVAGVVACSCSACVLGVPADEYGFAPILNVDDSDDAGPNNQNNTDDGVPVDPPFLIFTELLIDAPGSDPLVGERGEYIELKNLGPGPADPRKITIFLTDLDQPLLGRLRIEVPPPFGADPVYEGLQWIQPGEYFVFIRYEDPDVAAISANLAPGTTYDFGLHANGPSLPHAGGSRRSLDIGYRFANGDVEPSFDQVRWVGNELRGPSGDKPMTFVEGQALGVDAQFEDPAGNDDPENWCRPADEVAPADPESTEAVVWGTPGRPTTCP